MSALVIGVDGGGTKTVAWLARPDDQGHETVLGKGQAGPGNPRAAGFEVAQTNIDVAIAAAFAEAGMTREPVSAACLALAGAGRSSERTHIAAWALDRGLADTVQVTTDAEPILSAAS